MGLLRIVPGDPDGTGACLTQGTKVLMPDGQALPSVTKVVLTAEVNGLWRADITCHVRAPEITAEGFIHREVTDLNDDWRRYESPSWWRRALVRLANLGAR